MSHLTTQAAIFSPSVARAAASTAKDWAYVDAWLRRQFSSSSSRQSLPTFERNTETLEALLALVAANEEADEERDRFARLEAAALDEVRGAEEEKADRRRRQQQRQQQQSVNDDDDEEEEDDEEDTPSTPIIHGDILSSDLLEALDSGLSKDGLTALDAMADISLALGVTSSTSLTPSGLAHHFVEQQGRAHEAEHMLHRVQLLQSHLDDESARLSTLVEELRLSPQYRLPASTIPNTTTTTTTTTTSSTTSITTTTRMTTAEELTSENIELERAIKAMASRLPELQRRVESLGEKVGGDPPLTVDDVRRDEESYLDLLAQKKDLDAQVRAFAGLPPDVDAARAELEGLRDRLREATERRDANFEMLVERETPAKVRSTRRL